MSTKSKPHIKSQTGIRGLAALLVVPVHLGLKVIFPEAGDEVVDFFPAATAVNLFFILSGFILCYVYIEDSQFQGSWRRFYRARFARIYPLYFVLILVGYLANLLAGTGGTGESWVKDFAKTVVQLVMLHPYPGLSFGGWIFPSWSLAMEFLAYLVIFPTAVFLGVTRIRSVYLILGMVVILVAVFSFVRQFVNGPHFLGWGALLRICTFFPMGMLFFQLALRAPKEVDLLSRWSTVLTVTCLLYWFLDEVCFDKFELYSEWALVGLLLCFLKDSNTLVCRFLSTRPLQWLGKVSYSIYLFHILVGGILVSGIGEHWFLSLGLIEKLSFVFLQVCVVLVCSELLYRWIEVPGKNWVLSCFSRFGSRRKALVSNK